MGRGLRFAVAASSGGVSLLLAGCFFLSLDGLSGGGDAGASRSRDAAPDVRDAGARTDAREPEDGGAPGEASSASIRCMDGAVPAAPAGAYCAPPQEECCAYQPSNKVTLSCTARGACGDASETEIRCDDPSQCAGGACWLCRDGMGYLNGTSCASSAFGCSATTAIPICPQDGGGCDGGKTCRALTGLKGFPDGWFHVCQ
jgi:hypothetical protein